MRKILYYDRLLTTMLFFLFSFGVVNAQIANGTIYGNFGVTDSSYADQSNWDQIVENVFGSEYRVADWNDLKDFYANGGDLLDLFDGLGLTKYGANAFVTRDGVRNYSSTRYYFAARHEHNKPASFLDHDNIDNYLITLGSWYGTKKIMVVKKSIVTNSDDGTIYGNFGVTDSRYADQSNWDQIVENVFGPEYRVADWNDLKDFYANGGDLLDLFDGLGLTEYGANAFVTRDGVRNYSSTRYYFAARHEHNKPASFLDHDNIDNYLITLGSWYGARKIMVVKKSTTPVTTIITHGFDIDVGTPEWSDYKWQFSMADAVSPDRQIVFLRKGKFYLSNLDYEGYQSLSDDRSIDDIVSSLFLTESDFSLDSKRNVVIIFDWVEESDFESFGWAEAAGDVLAASLIRLAEKYPWILKKLHFIGHSRGTVVNSEAIQRLIYYAWQGYLDDFDLDKDIHMTTLDPHPAGHWPHTYAPQRDDDVNSEELNIGVSGWIGGDYSTAYIDNYYETSGRTPIGLKIRGLDYFPGLIYSYNLDEKFGDAESTHSLVHTWYHGTVDTKAEKDEFGSGNAIENSWYSQRNNEGFAFSFLRKDDLSAIASDRNSFTSVQDFGYFNDSKLIFNGDFLINSYGNEYYTPGWNFQGGNGGASVYFTHLDLNWITPSKTHNYFYIAKDKIYFSVSVTKKSQDDELHVTLLDQNDNSLIDKTIPLTWYTSFKNYSLDVSEYRGTVKRLKFEIVNNGLMIDSEVLVDNVGFEKYDDMEAVIALDSDISSSNSLKKAAAGSDVYLHVYNGKGNHTGQINDSTWVTEIPGSYYYVSPDSIDKPFKAVYLPKPAVGQEYTFKFESKGAAGHVDFSINDFSNGESAQTATFDSIQISENTVAETNLSQVDSTTTLRIDSDGDGNADTTLSTSVYLMNYSIIARAGAGGSISPKDTVFILKGDSVTYSITPDSGYVIADVKVDSISKGALDSYSFNDVDRDQTIYAEFKLGTSIKSESNLPNNYFLNQNYPNPFNPSTEITFSLAKASFVTLEVFNALGQKIKTLINARQSAGRHTVRVQLSAFASGVYYYRLKADDYTQTRKMILMK